MSIRSSLVLVAAACGLLSCGPPDSSTRISHSSLRTVPASVEFGSYERGHRGDTNVLIESTGPATLVISGVRVEPEGAPFSVGKLVQSELAAGASVNVGVAFLAPQADGEHKAELVIESNAPESNPFRVPLVGQSQGACSMESNSEFCQRHSATCGLLEARDTCQNLRKVNCGSCTLPNTCGGSGTANVCGCPAESTQKFCARLKKNCGAVTGVDNCGVKRTVDSCGTCTSPTTCGGDGVANVCSCKKETNSEFCARSGKNCGTFTGVDNCGLSRTAYCGTCTSPQSCSAGGTPNVCGCGETNLAFCSRLGKNCGSVTAPDKCGVTRTVTCGACTAPKTCGGAGTANVCG